MSLFAEDVAARLESRNVATRSAANRTLFIGSHATYPTTDGPFVTVIEYPGPPPEHTHNQGPIVAYQHPKAQIVVRGRDALAIRHKADEAYAALQLANEVVGGAFYLSLQPLQDVHDLPPDDNRRARVGFNVVAYRRA